MKWIKYQIVCGKNENKEDILISKKVGYSEANLAIAEEEAHNGEYEIVEDTESYDKEPLEVEFGGTSAKTPKNARKNLGISGEKLIDSNVASTKVVPESSGKYAAVNKVGGMSYKSRNLLEVTATTQTINGITFTVNSDSSITAKGTATDNAVLLLASQSNIDRYSFLNKNLILSGCSGGSSTTYRLQCWNFDGNGTLSFDYGSGASFAFKNTTDNFNFAIHIQSGATVNTTFYPMILEATETNKSYEPYYSGLRNAYVNKITTTGKNLLNITATTQTSNGVTFTVNADKSVAVSGTATAYTRLLLGCETVLPKGNYVLSGNLLNSGLYLRVYNINTNEIENDIGNGIDFSSNGTDKYQFFIIVDSGIQINTIVYPMLRRTTEETNTNYEPYKESILEIPDAIKDLDGYGLGINQNCYNHIDYRRKKFVRRCEKRVLTENDNLKVIGNTFGLDNFKNHATGGDNLICDTLPVASYPAHLTGIEYSIGFHHHESFKNYLYITLPSDVVAVKDLEAFKTWIAENPITIVYQIEPEETDISEYLPDDNFIEVAAGGVVTAVNEYNYDAPTEIEFYVSDSNKDIVVADTFVGNLIGVAEKAKIAENAQDAQNAQNAKVAENLSNLIEDSENPGCYYRIVNGAQEWINPPMKTNVEYKTTERWSGRAVYTQVFGFAIDETGVGSESELKTLPLQTDIESSNLREVVKCNCMIIANSMDSETPRVRVLPCANSVGGSVDIHGIFTDSSKIKVKLILNKVLISNAEIKIQLWYTKTE